MKAASILTMFAAALVMFTGAARGQNPYSSIVTRNPFALVAPPPQPSTEPVVVPSNVKLTGISTLFGNKKAMLMVTEGGPGKTPTYMSLVEGEQNGPITCNSISVEEGVVKITNAGRNETLNFKDNGLVAAPTPVPQPAAPQGQPGGMVSPAPGAPIPAPGAGGVTSIGGNNPQGQPIAQPGIQAPVNNGLRQIPSRPVRGGRGNSAAVPQGTANVAVEAAASAALLEIEREHQLQRGSTVPVPPPAPGQ